MDLFEYQGKQYFARYGIPVSAGGVADTVEEAVAAGRQGRLPGRRQGPGPGRGPGQGRRHQAGRQRRRGPPPRRQHPRPGHQGPRRAPPVGRARLGHRQGVLRQLHPRPGAPRSTSAMVSARGGVEIEQVADGGPGRHRPPAHRSVDRASPRRTPASWSTRPASTPRPGTVRSAILLNLYRCYVEGDADLVEINPLILTPDGRVHALDAKVTLDDNAAFRHPEWDDFRDIDELDERERLARSKGLQYVGLDGVRRHHRQRRRPGHEHLRRRQPGRRDRRPTSSTSAAGPTPRSWPTPSRSSTPTRRCGPSSSTSSAASREATRWPTASWQALGRVEIGAPMVIRLDGTNAEEGREILKTVESDRVISQPTMLDGGPQSRRAGGRRSQVSIFVDENTKVVVQGLTGGQGRFHGLRNRAYGTKVVAGVTPGKGGEDVEGIPVFDTVAEAVAATGANASFVSVPPRGRRRRPSWRRPRPGSRSSSASPRASRPTTRPGSTTSSSGSIPGPGCSGPTARGSSARESATSASPPARSPCPAARSASSAARAPSPTRPCTS